MSPAQGLLETIPGEGLGEDPLRVEDQVAAVGPVEESRLDQVEIRDQGAHLRQVLDAPDEILKGRVLAVDHRGATGGAVIDEKVHLVAGEGRLEIGDRNPHELRPLLRAAEVVAVLDDIQLHLLEVAHHLRVIGVGFPQLLDQVPHREGGDLPGERLDLLVRLPLHARHVVKALPELFLQRRNLLLQLLALRLGQLLELIRRQDLALHDRGEDEPDRRAQQGDPLAPAFLLDGSEALFLTLLELLLDHLLARPVLLGLEGPRDRGAQLLDQPLHVPPERDPASRRQAQRARLVGTGEVVDVAPVGRRRRLGCSLLEELAHEGAAPGAGMAQGKDVVAGLAHLDPEAHGIDRAGLAHDPVEVLDLVGGLEGEAAGIAPPVEERGVQRLRSRHRQHPGVRGRCRRGHGPQVPSGDGGLIVTAWGPLCPCSMSSATRWPSWRWSKSSPPCTAFLWK